MNDVRYYIALFVVAASPGAFLYWFSIHPFIAFWRRVGPRLTVVIHLTLILVLAIGVFLIREPLLGVEFGTQPVLILLAALTFVPVVVLRVTQARRLGTKVLVGLPELAPENYPTPLITEGIYSRIRHPRYMQILLTFLACALFSNHLAAYVVFLLSVVWILLVVRAEEKELRERFGEEYERYSERVPRFLPRFSTGKS